MKLFQRIAYGLAFTFHIITTLVQYLFWTLRAKLTGTNVAVGGVFTETINGTLVGVHRNLVTTQGLNHMAVVVLGATAKTAAWYVALYSNDVSPQLTWTAANFNANAAEITSESEGYTGTNRPQWVPNATSTGVIDNYGGEAEFTIECTTTLTVAGCAILSAQARGATTGILLAATKFPTARVLNDTDNYRVGYRFTFGNAA